MRIARARALPLPSRRLLLVVAASILVALASSFTVYLIKSHLDNAYATLAGFDAGNIMDDAVMANKNTMSESQIQSFLDSKNTCKTSPKNPAGLVTINSTGTEGVGTWNGVTYKYHMKDSKFICVADQDFSGESAAHIIYRAAQDYSVNPQVLIVLLQKEQGIITDNWPNYNVQYRSATGYGCPDTADCDSQYYGFKNQIRNAAGMFHTLLQGQGINNYPIGTNTILYNPNSSCGSSKVDVKNLATGALYTYTPYQPNADALAAGWGTAPCGAYGNRNFYNYFTDWFGSTHYIIHGAIATKYTALGGQATLGMVLSNEITASADGVYQRFQNGRIYWTSATGAWYIHGGSQTKYLSLGGDRSYLGYPTSDEISISGGVYQQFQNGRIYWTASTGGTFNVHGGIYGKYGALGMDKGTLGTPSGDEVAISGGVYQQFQNGRIYWSSKTGARGVSDATLSRYQSAQESSGFLGFPIADAIETSAGTVQRFQGGRIYATSNQTYIVHGGIGDRYSIIGADSGYLGLPASDEISISGGVYQQFQNGRIYWTASTAGWDLTNDIVDLYTNLGGQSGFLGYPTGGITSITSGSRQQFQGGAIYTTGSGMFVVHGGIGARYSTIGSESGYIGLPTSDETAIPNGVYQQFQNGRIYWSSKTGARDVHGAIQKRYLDLGSDSGFLGFPISNEVQIYGGVYQQFQNGRIYWSSKTGAWEVHGAIGSSYLRLGAEQSRLGYPTTGEIANTSESGVYQNYYGGTIAWKSGESTVVTYSR